MDSVFLVQCYLVELFHLSFSRGDFWFNVCFRLKEESRWSKSYYALLTGRKFITFSFYPQHL